MVLAELRPGFVHIAHYDRKMLEPEIVAVGGHGDRPDVGRRKKLNQFELLLAQSHPNDARA